MVNRICRVDGKFTPEGIGVTAYDDTGAVVDETWFTWDEVEEMKHPTELAFTFGGFDK